MKIVFLDRGTLRADIGLPPLPFPHELDEHDRTAPDQVIPRLRGAQVAIVNKVRLGAAELAALPDLKLIAVAATGTDNIDLDACRARGVQVANVRGYAQGSVPEHAFALILALVRGLPGYRQAVADWPAAGQFCLHGPAIGDLEGAVLGLVGRGLQGQAMGRIGAAFGMRVLYAERKGMAAARPGYTPFAQVLAEANVLSLHCPLTPQTRHLLGPADFAQMARRPILINVARGALVDEVALAAALEAGQIAGAGLDVLAEEPPPPGHPLLALAARPDVIVTPHVAWASERAMRRLMAEVAAHITRFAAS